MNKLINGYEVIVAPAGSHNEGCVKVIGPNNTSVEVMAASITHCPVTGTPYPMVTVVAEYQRFIHAEVMTHRQLSKCASSSRAIPVATMLKTIGDDPASPVHWGKNQPGMQAKEECDGEVSTTVYLKIEDLVTKIGDPVYERHKRLLTGADAWKASAMAACVRAQEFAEAGYHKQIVNRITEPYQRIRVCISGTEWGNLFWLRCHPDAQPEFQVLASLILEAMKLSKFQVLRSGQWHLPFVKKKYTPAAGVESGQDVTYFDSNDNEIQLDEAIRISVSCAAQTSYRKLDDTSEKADDLFKRLIDSVPVHASPTEHQATPLSYLNILSHSDAGATLLRAQPLATHLDRNGDYWSGNLCGWGQYRQLVANNAYTGNWYNEYILGSKNV